MKRFAHIPGWLLIAIAALRTAAILVIVVHPYVDVSNATAAEKIIARVLGLLMTGLLAAILLLPAGAVFLANLPRLQPVKVAKPNCARRN